MDPLWITIAFVFGFLVKFIGLPPLVGYLIAGFVLHQFGAESGEFISIISELGITLLLFTIGLKFKFKDLLRKEIWLGTSIYTISTALVYSFILFVLSSITIYLFSELNLSTIFLIAFGMSFSSTVFAMKSLEDKGEVQAIHGRIAIGVLIIQDIFAVIFMAILFINDLSFWALAIPVVLLLFRPVLMKIFDWIGHGELLTLFGLFLGLVLGPELFQLVGLKSDLGALVIGMMVADNKKAHELATTLLNFKDIFLIGFFLSIGLSGLPTSNAIIISILLVLLIPIKSILYFYIFTKFNLRARTAFHATVTLSNFSEFGLIVTSVGIAAGLIAKEWLVIFAIILSISFVIVSPFSLQAHKIYSRFRKHLKTLQSADRVSGDEIVGIGNAEILVFGLGRVGITVYNQLTQQYGQKVLGIDFNEDIIKGFKEEGKNVIQDDSTDSEFWERIQKQDLNQVRLVMLCIHDYKTILYTVERLKEINFENTIAALAEFDDQVEELKQLGIHFPFNFYNEAGVGFADQICEFIGCDLDETVTK